VNEWVLGKNPRVRVFSFFVFVFPSIPRLVLTLQSPPCASVRRVGSAATPPRPRPRPPSLRHFRFLFSLFPLLFSLLPLFDWVVEDGVGGCWARCGHREGGRRWLGMGEQQQGKSPFDFSLSKPARGRIRWRRSGRPRSPACTFAFVLVPCGCVVDSTMCSGVSAE